MDKKVINLGLVEATPGNGIAKSADPVSQESISYEPKTPLGLKLQEIRIQVIASSMPLLGSAEIEKEVAERRGGEEWAH